MAIRAVAVPSGLIRTSALEACSGFCRIAAATPMPTSQRPSLVWPGLATRASQPKRRAPSRRQGIRFRVEYGTCFSGSCAGSLRMRSSIGSRPTASASSSIAHSSASRPTASPGARMAEATGMSRAARRCRVSRFSPAYSVRVCWAAPS